MGRLSNRRKAHLANMAKARSAQRSGEIGKLLIGLEDRLNHIKNTKKEWLNKNRSRNMNVFTCWNFQVGRSYFPTNVNVNAKKFYDMVDTTDGRRAYVYKFMESTNKEDWMKALYSEYLLPLIHFVDKEWSGPDNEWMCQINIMDYGEDREHAVKEHKDTHDRSHQYAVVLGSYTGTKFETYTKKNESDLWSMDLRNKVVKVDGRYHHRVTPIKSGTRFSLYYYKQFDRRYIKQPKLWPPEIVFAY